jgi:hypothetical protein
MSQLYAVVRYRTWTGGDKRTMGGGKRMETRHEKWGRYEAYEAPKISFRGGFPDQTEPGIAAVRGVQVHELRRDKIRQ